MAVTQGVIRRYGMELTKIDYPATAKEVDSLRRYLRRIRRDCRRAMRGADDVTRMALKQLVAQVDVVQKLIRSDPYMSPRGGFYRLKPCVICGQLFEVRQKPSRPENIRVTCSSKCSDRNARNVSNAYRKMHKNQYAEYSRKYHQRNREKRNKASLEYYYRNHERCKERHRRWTHDNLEKVVAYNRERRRGKD